MILHRRAATLGAVRSLASWLFVVVNRLCLRLAMSALPGQPPPWSAPAAIDTAEPLALRHDLARAIESLPERHRAVLLLRDVEGCTIAEIAEQLAITTAAAKARLHRARAMMRDYLR